MNKTASYCTLYIPIDQKLLNLNNSGVSQKQLVKDLYHHWNYTMSTIAFTSYQNTHQQKIIPEKIDNHNCTSLHHSILIQITQNKKFLSTKKYTENIYQHHTSGSFNQNVCQTFKMIKNMGKKWLDVTHFLCVCVRISWGICLWWWDGSDRATPSQAASGTWCLVDW